MRLGFLSVKWKDWIEAKFGNAGELAPIGVQNEINRYQKLNEEFKNEVPLLSYLIPEGTQPYKMERGRAGYIDRSLKKENCANCNSMYQHSFSGSYICSRAQGAVRPEGYCRLWNPGNESRYAQ